VRWLLRMINSAPSPICIQNSGSSDDTPLLYIFYVLRGNGLAECTGVRARFSRRSPVLSPLHSITGVLLTNYSNEIQNHFSQFRRKAGHHRDNPLVCKSNSGSGISQHIAFLSRKNGLEMSQNFPTRRLLSLKNFNFSWFYGEAGFRLMCAVRNFRVKVIYGRRRGRK